MSDFEKFLKENSAISFAENVVKEYDNKMEKLQNFYSCKDEVEPCMELLNKRAFVYGLKNYRNCLEQYIEQFEKEI